MNSIKQYVSADNDIHFGFRVTVDWAEQFASYIKLLKKEFWKKSELRTYRIV